MWMLALHSSWALSKSPPTFNKMSTPHHTAQERFQEQWRYAIHIFNLLKFLLSSCLGGSAVKVMPKINEKHVFYMFFCLSFWWWGTYLRKSIFFTQVIVNQNAIGKKGNLWLRNFTCRQTDPSMLSFFLFELVSGLNLYGWIAPIFCCTVR